MGVKLLLTTAIALYNKYWATEQMFWYQENFVFKLGVGLLFKLGT